MAYTRIDTGLADFDRSNPWKKEYVSHMEDGIDDCEDQITELKQSLDELNTNLDILNSGTAISSGDDLNNYTTPGRYNSASSSVSSTLENTPITGAGFAFFVFRAGARIVQLAIIAGAMTATVGTCLYIRNVSGTTWTSWYGLEGNKL